MPMPASESDWGRIYFFELLAILKMEERCALNEVAAKYFPENVLTMKKRRLRCAPFEFIENLC